LSGHQSVTAALVDHGGAVSLNQLADDWSKAVRFDSALIEVQPVEDDLAYGSLELRALRR